MQITPFQAPAGICPVKNQCFALIVQTAFQRIKETTLTPLEGIAKVVEVTFSFSFMIKLGWEEEKSLFQNDK